MRRMILSLMIAIMLVGMMAWMSESDAEISVSGAEMPEADIEISLNIESGDGELMM